MSLAPAAPAPLPGELAGWRGRHDGETLVVCGCGRSLLELPEPERWVTVGVNDVGRRFDPTYLVVLNPKSQFRGDRFRWVEASRATALFTQLDPGRDLGGLGHPAVVRFRLGRRAGTELDGPDSLPYTRNSPYVAVCLAALMGARRIGLVGVDFTDHHFFARTGRHPLSRELRQIDREYGRLHRALGRRGVELVNLSRESRLTALPKVATAVFLGLTGPRPVAQAPAIAAPETRAAALAAAAPAEPATADGEGPVTAAAGPLPAAGGPPPRVFFVHYRFLSCGDVFQRGLEAAARDLGLASAGTDVEDRRLPAKLAAFAPDLLFVVHGRSFRRRWRSRFRRIPSAVWLLDEPYEVDDTERTSRLFDTVLVNDPATLGRHRNAHYLPVAWDPHVHRDGGGPRPRRVGFVGGGNPTREAMLLRLAGEGLLDYLVGGPWTAPALRRLCLGRNVPPARTAELYRETRLVINVFRDRHHYNRHRVPATSLNPRVYEALGCGALVVSERRPELAEVFPEVPGFADADELVDVVRRLLDDPGELDRRLAASRARLAPHTYAERLRRTLELALPRAAAAAQAVPGPAAEPPALPPVATPAPRRRKTRAAAVPEPAGRPRRRRPPAAGTVTSATATAGAEPAETAETAETAGGDDLAGRRVFFVHYRFATCGDLFAVALERAAGELGLEHQSARADDPGLERKVEAFDPELLWVTHGRVFRDRWGRRLRRRPNAVWLVEEPYEVDDSARTSRLFDTVFVNDPATLDRHRNAHYLPVAWDPVLHHPGDGDRPHAVGFVGGGTPGRDRLLAALAREKLLSYVVGWPWRQPAVRRKTTHRRIPPQAAADLYRRTRLVVNLFRDRHQKNRRRVPATSLNPRVYEALACGALVVSEPRPEVAEVFPELPTFEDRADLVRVVRGLLADDERRRSLLAACRARLAPHTYAARLRQALAVALPPRRAVPDRRPGPRRVPAPRAASGGERRAATPDAPDLTVVVGVRAPAHQPERRRNARAVLEALGRQTLPRRRYRVVVVEQDEEPRLGEELGELADRWLHAYNRGPYNRGWGFNVGAWQPEAEHGPLCLLDADLLVPPDFLARCAATLAGGVRAAIPYDRLLFLDAGSTERALAAWRSDPDRPLDPAAYGGRVYGDSTGGCLWIDAGLYREVGGHDERFRGWGRENHEMLDRLRRRTRVPRQPGTLLHLDHPAPVTADPSVLANRTLYARLKRRPAERAPNDFPGDPDLYRGEKAAGQGPFKVSIVLPTFRRPHTLGRTLKTILAQTYRNWELIVVDNAGDARLPVTDPRIRLVRHSERASSSYARNRGLDHVTGELVCFFDDDDDMFPTYLERFVETFDRHPRAKMVRCGLILASGRLVYSNGTPEICLRRRYATPSWCDRGPGQDQRYFRRLIERHRWSERRGDIVVVRQALVRAHHDPAGGLRAGSF